jgi:hypothetical protein
MADEQFMFVRDPTWGDWHLGKSYDGEWAETECGKRIIPPESPFFAGSVPYVIASDGLCDACGLEGD